MNGRTHALDDQLEVGAGDTVSGAAALKQSDRDIEPYSGLFGTLKVRDEVRVLASATAPDA
jgi:hypothetical protein